MNEKQPLTMKDIAAQLGVSVATVSRALKNSPNISKKRREMIQQYAREHDYYPNVIAEQLRHSRQKPSQIIGVILLRRATSLVVLPLCAPTPRTRVW